jgi:predicted Zn-dependent protease
MGHEISHALANHTAERMSMALATQLGLSGVAVAAGENKYKDAILTGSSLAAATAITLPNSRTSESEADRMGIELAAKAGYDPRSAATLWEKMAKVGGGGPPQFLSTHPSPTNRQETLRALAQQMMGYYLEKYPRPVYQLQ